MHRRSLLRLAFSLPAVVGAGLLPNIARAANNLIPLEELYSSMHAQFRLWGVKELMGRPALSVEPVFSEEEMRAYVEMSVSWMNFRLEGEEISESLPGDPEQFVGDAIFTNLQGDARRLWKDCLVWISVTHAMFALSLNFVPGENGGMQLVPRNRDPRFWEYKEQAEAQHDAVFDAFLDQAERQYRPV